MKPTIKAILATLLVIIIISVLLFFTIKYPNFMLSSMMIIASVYFVVSVFQIFNKFFSK